MGEKVVLLGNAGVGKTCLCEALEKHAYNAKVTPTVGAQYKRITITYEGRVLRVNVWDTAGQPQFRELIPLYLRDAALVLVCFGVNEPSSLADAAEWAGMVSQVSGAHEAVIGLVGCKTDLMRTVGRDEVEEVRARIKAEFFCETSGRTGEGLDVLSVEIARGLIGRSPRVLQEGITVRERSAKRSSCC